MLISVRFDGRLDFVIAHDSWQFAEAAQIYRLKFVFRKRRDVRGTSGGGGHRPLSRPHQVRDERGILVGLHREDEPAWSVAAIRPYGEPSTRFSSPAMKVFCCDACFRVVPEGHGIRPR